MFNIQYDYSQQQRVLFEKPFVTTFQVSFFDITFIMRKHTQKNFFHNFLFYFFLSLYLGLFLAFQSAIIEKFEGEQKIKEVKTNVLKAHYQHMVHTFSFTLSSFFFWCGICKNFRFLYSLCCSLSDINVLHAIRIYFVISLCCQIYSRWKDIFSLSAFYFFSGHPL